MSDAPKAGSTATSTLPIMLLLLTFTTGLVDAVSFLGLGHVFTANMTGNVVFVGFALVGAEGVSAPRSLVAIAAFLIGAAIGGRLGVIMMHEPHRRWLSWTAGIESVLLVAGAISALGYDPTNETPVVSLYAIVVTTAMAMGLRNATALRLKDPDLKTTVLTLTLTGIAADSSVAGGQNPRLSRRLLSVFALFAGAAVGAGMLAVWGAAAALFAMAVIVILATALYTRHPASAVPR